MSYCFSMIWNCVEVSCLKWFSFALITWSFSSDLFSSSPELFFANITMNAAYSFPSHFCDSFKDLSIKSGSEVKYSYFVSSSSTTELVYFLFQYNVNLSSINITVGMLSSQVDIELETLQVGYSNQEISVNSIHRKNFYFCRSYIRWYRYRQCHLLRNFECSSLPSGVILLFPLALLLGSINILCEIGFEKMSTSGSV